MVSGCRQIFQHSFMLKRITLGLKCCEIEFILREFSDLFINMENLDSNLSVAIFDRMRS